MKSSHKWILRLDTNSHLQLAISWGWNLANIIVRLSRARPMHPGANVGMDLFLWISFAITAVFAMFAAIVRLIALRR